jgi:hypothetical protein
MKKMRYSKKINQFRNLSRRINEKLSDGTWQELSASSQSQMVFKLRQLFGIVKNLLGSKELKKVLAAAAIFLCFTAVKAQTFNPPVSNPFGIAGLDSVMFPSFVDIDNDGDQDMFVLELYGNNKYYQNIGTASAPSFTGAVQNPFGLSINPNSLNPDFADLDGDGDFDLLIGEYYGFMRYYQNTGTSSAPNFISGVQLPFGLDTVNQIALPAFADLDNDGDQDLMVSSYYGRIDYFENIGSATVPNFSAPVGSPFGIDSADSDAFIDFADLDNDGDLDMLAGIYYYGDLLYYSNTGTASSPAFALPQNNPFGLSTVLSNPIPAFVDIDNDGDMDLFLGSMYDDNVIYFYENTTYNPVVVNNPENIQLDIFPVPATDQLTVRCNNNSGEISLTMLDELGNIVKTAVVNDRNFVLQTSDLASGVYILEFRGTDFVIRKKTVIK